MCLTCQLLLYTPSKIEIFTFNLEFGILNNPLNGMNFYCSFYSEGRTYKLCTSLSEPEQSNDYALSVFESNIVDNIKRKLAGNPDKWNNEIDLYSLVRQNVKVDY